MSNQDQILLRQFLLFFVLPIFVIIVGSVIAVNIYSERQTDVQANKIQIGPLMTNESESPIELEGTSITVDQLDSEGKPASNISSSSTPGPKQTSKVIVSKNFLFYAGLVVCSGILVVIIGGGVFFILAPTKNKK